MKESWVFLHRLMAAQKVIEPFKVRHTEYDSDSRWHIINYKTRCHQM